MKSVGIHMLQLPTCDDIAMRLSEKATGRRGWGEKGGERGTHARWAAVRRVPVPLLADAAVRSATASEMLIPGGRLRFSPMF